MSHCATLEFRLASECSPLVVLGALMEYGWAMEDYGGITYLPLGDKDFNWRTVPANEKSDVVVILKEKELKKEAVGVVLTWGDSLVGGSFVFENNGFYFNISVNRKVLNEGGGFTDPCWYLSKIFPSLTNKSIDVESVEFTDHS